MERDTLSFRQLMALLWAGLLGPAAELLPGTGAQAGAVGALAVLPLGLLMAVSGGIFWCLAQPGGGLAVGLRDSLGCWLGSACLFLYIMWGELLLTVRLRLSAQRLMGVGERDGTIWFFLIILAVMALWMARGHLGALGRAAELMFAILLAAAGTVLLLALSQTRSVNLMARWQWSAAAAGELFWSGLGVLGYGVFAGFLLQPEAMEHPKRKWLKWTTIGCLLLTVAQIIIIGCFGPELTQRLSSPFFQLAKSVGVEGAFQRVESVIVGLWTFSDLILLAGILWAIRRIAAVLWPNASGQGVAAMAVLPAVVAALALFGESGSAQETVKIVVPIGNLTFGFAIPLLILLCKAIRQNK